jgi:hypothetical protein
LALISSATALSACVVPAQAQVILGPSSAVVSRGSAAPVILGPSSARVSNGSSYTPRPSYRPGSGSSNRYPGGSSSSSYRYQPQFWQQTYQNGNYNPYSVPGL